MLIEDRLGRDSKDLNFDNPEVDLINKLNNRVAYTLEELSGDSRCI